MTSGQNAEIVTQTNGRLNITVICLIGSLFKMGTSLKGKNSIPFVANYFLEKKSLTVWKNSMSTLCDFFKCLQVSLQTCVNLYVMSTKRTTLAKLCATE